jgi:hypothetical protein
LEVAEYAHDFTSLYEQSRCGFGQVLGVLLRVQPGKPPISPKRHTDGPMPFGRLYRIFDGLS